MLLYNTVVINFLKESTVQNPTFTSDLKAFAKEFETAIEILESRYQNGLGSQAENMRARIAEMQELRNGWRDPDAKSPTEQHIFSVLMGIVRHLFSEQEQPNEVPTAVEFYLALGRMRDLAGSSWLACSLYDMERGLLDGIRSAHTLTNPALP